MVWITVNAVLALVCMHFARIALIHAVPMLRTGWLAIDTSVRQPGYRENIEKRRRISDGGRLLLSGIGWAITGVVSLGLGVFFAVETLRLTFA